MITDFDLAERAGVSVDIVRRWLRHRGYGGKRGQRIPASIEQAFLAAHGVDPRMTASPAVQPVPRVTQPLSARPTPTPRQKPSAAQIIAQDSARRITDLQRELAEVRAELTAAQAALKAARAAAERSAPPVVAAAPPSAPSVRAVFAQQGIDGRAAVTAFEAVWAIAAPRVLDGLSVHQPELFAKVHPVCSTVACRTVARLNDWVVVPGSAGRCGVCRGSDNRRWFRLMALRLKRAGRERLLVVGGAPDCHADLRRLQRDAPSLKIRVVDGEKRMDASRARALVVGCDVVAFWSGSVLPHAVSDPIKTAARGTPNVIRAVTAGGGRGVASLCQAVLEALDQQTSADTPARA